MTKSNSLPPAAARYVQSITALGAVVLVWCVSHWPNPPGIAFMLCLAGAILLPPIKLRLPGLTGTYSPGFLPVLWALAHLSLAEAVVAGCLVALSQSYLNAKQRPTAQQAAFNVANLTLSVAVCHNLQQLITRGGVAPNHAAALALIAAMYFVLNTGVVSGVLALLQGKALKDVASSWYTWSLPYHLLGAAALALVPVPGEQVRWEAAMIVVALLILVHFYCALQGSTWNESVAAPSQPMLPLGFLAYVSVVVAAAAALLGAAVLMDGVPEGWMLPLWLAVTALIASLKLRLPGIEGTLSPGFVCVLAAVAEMRLSEVLLVGGVAAAVQCLWKPANKVRSVQVVFSMAGLILSAGLAFVMCRVVMAQALAGSLTGVLALATVVLYGANTLLVCGVLCLAERKSLGDVWRTCHFWVLAYYLVGACGTGLIVSVGRTAGWGVSLLVVPALLLVFVSYRLQVRDAIRRVLERSAAVAAG